MFLTGKRKSSKIFLSKIFLKYIAQLKNLDKLTFSHIRESIITCKFSGSMEEDLFLPVAVIKALHFASHDEGIKKYLQPA